jgi:hypothetical protein
MAVAGKADPTARQWLTWTFWAAGVALLLVELNAGMEYFQAGLQQNMGDLLGWAPAMGMITLKLAEQSLWHWETLAVVSRAVPIGALGLLLVALAVALNKQSSAASQRSVKKVRVSLGE